MTEIVADRDELLLLISIVKDKGLSRVGFEDEISVSYYQFRAAFAGLDCFHRLSLLKHCMIKDEKEIMTIRKACLPQTKL